MKAYLAYAALVIPGWALMVPCLSMAVEQPGERVWLTDTFPYRRFTQDWDPQAVAAWKKAPLFLRVSMCDRALEYLDSPDAADAAPMPDAYRWPPDGDDVWQSRGHDLRRVAGRAAAALESVTGVRLPQVRPTSEAADLRGIRRIARDDVAEYRQKALAAEAARPNKPSVQELREKYRGKITPGLSKEAAASATALFDLLVEWCPLGQDRRTLEAIVGAPLDKSTSGAFYYRFEVAGLPFDIGTAYRFTTNGDIITIVDLASIRVSETGFNGT